MGTNREFERKLWPNFARIWTITSHWNFGYVVKCLLVFPDVSFNIVNIFSFLRILFTLGVVNRNGEILYVLSFRDSIEPICVPAIDARVWSKKLLFDFLLKKVEHVGIVSSGGRSPLKLLGDNHVSKENPDIMCMQFYTIKINNDFIFMPLFMIRIFNIFIFIDINDLTGQINFFLKYSDGIKMASVTEVKEKWPELAVHFFEQHLVVEPAVN